MIVLGLRCSNTDYHFVVLDGSIDSPNLLDHGKASVPAGYRRVEVIHWMVQEVQAMIDKYSPKRVSMRASEVMKAKTTLLERIELEAAVYAAAGSKGIKAVFKKRRATIAKDLGLLGRASSLSEFDTAVLNGYDDLAEKGKEAALAAWSAL